MKDIEEFTFALGRLALENESSRTRFPASSEPGYVQLRHAGVGLQNHGCESRSHS